MTSAFSDPVSLLYDAALGESSWGEAFEAISRQVDHASFCLGIGDPRRPDLQDIWKTRDIDHEVITDAGFDIADLWNPEMNPCVRAGLTMPVGQTVDARRYVSDATMHAAPMMAAFINAHRIGAQHLYVPLRDADLLAGGFIAKRGGAVLEGEPVRRFDRMLPHLGRALRLRNEIGRRRGLAESLQSLFDRLAVAVMVVDRDLRILGFNDRADAILASADGISARRSVLRLADPRQARLLLDHVATCARRNGGAGERIIGVSRPSGLPPYLLRVFPAIGACTLPGAHAAAACVTIHDPVAIEALPDRRLLGAALGLTPAEAEVARLAPLALSKRQVADRLGVSENTVKYHLLNIRAKLGVRNATELARIMDQVALSGPHATVETDR